MILHTPRLLLRPFEEADWPGIHEYVSNNPIP